MSKGNTKPKEIKDVDEKKKKFSIKDSNNFAMVLVKSVLDLIIIFVVYFVTYKSLPYLYAMVGNVYGITTKSETVDIAMWQMMCMFFLGIGLIVDTVIARKSWRRFSNRCREIKKK